jgi:hypothetical protein
LVANLISQDLGVINSFGPRMDYAILGGRFDIRDLISLSGRLGRGINLCRPNTVDRGGTRSYRVRRGGGLARVFHGTFLVTGKRGCDSGRLSWRYLPSERSRTCGNWRTRRSAPPPLLLVFGLRLCRDRRRGRSRGRTLRRVTPDIRYGYCARIVLSQPGSTSEIRRSAKILLSPHAEW